MRKFTTEVFLDDFVFLEGPRWHDDALWISDIWAHKVYKVFEHGRREVVAAVPGRPSGLGFLPDGTPLVVSMEDRCLYQIIDGSLVLHADLSSHADAELNDMVVDELGRAYVGHMGYDLFSGAPPKDAEIFLVDPSGKVEVVARELNFPNGMVISNAGQTLVVSESFGHRMRAFDRGVNGRLSNPRVYAECPGQIPDGICLDQNDGIWVGGAMSGEFFHLDNNGQTDATIDVKPRAAIACQLGGADGRTLFCLTYAGGIEELSQGIPGARIEIATVDIPGVSSA